METAEDVVEELRGSLGDRLPVAARPAARSRRRAARDAPQPSTQVNLALDDEAARVLHAIAHEPVDLDTLAPRCGLTVDALYAILLPLERTGVSPVCLRSHPAQLNHPAVPHHDCHHRWQARPSACPSPGEAVLFDILVYLFESYIHADACPESDLLARKLSAAGFEEGDLRSAGMAGQLRRVAREDSPGRRTGRALGADLH